jgi:precorrin-2 dehydrogenase/sirohydrochlorin ferrochelatase
MRHYPLFLDLSSREVLVAGAGSVGRRKIRTLLKVPVRHVTVVDPKPPRSPLPEADNLLFLPRPFAPKDLEGKSLVFAATDSAETNARIVALCARRRIWCNRADDPESGNFFVPAHMEKNGITVAVSTGGKSPALAGIIRDDVEAWLGNRYLPILLLLERLRPLLLALPETGARADILYALVSSPLAETLARGDLAGSRDLLRRHLPAMLLPKINEILHDF